MRNTMRKSNNAMIFGVCAGIAEYLDTDPLWVRFIFGMLLGYAILPYILLAFIMEGPKEDGHKAP